MVTGCWPLRRRLSCWALATLRGIPGHGRRNPTAKATPYAPHLSHHIIPSLARRRCPCPERPPSACEVWAWAAHRSAADPSHRWGSSRVRTSAALLQTTQCQLPSVRRASTCPPSCGGLHSVLMRRLRPPVLRGPTRLRRKGAESRLGLVTKLFAAQVALPMCAARRVAAATFASHEILSLPGARNHRAAALARRSASALPATSVAVSGVPSPMSVPPMCSIVRWAGIHKTFSAAASSSK